MAAILFVPLTGRLLARTPRRPWRKRPRAWLTRPGFGSAGFLSVASQVHLRKRPKPKLGKSCWRQRRVPKVSWTDPNLDTLETHHRRQTSWADDLTKICQLQHQVQTNKKLRTSSLKGHELWWSQVIWSLWSLDLPGAKDALEDLESTAVALHETCDFTLQNFDARQKARSEEVDALNEAGLWLGVTKMACCYLVTFFCDNKCFLLDKITLISEKCKKMAKETMIWSTCFKVRKAEAKSYLSGAKLWGIAIRDQHVFSMDMYINIMNRSNPWQNLRSHYFWRIWDLLICWKASGSLWMKHRFRVSRSKIGDSCSWICRAILQWNMQDVKQTADRFLWALQPHPILAQASALHLLCHIHWHLRVSDVQPAHSACLACADLQHRIRVRTASWKFLCNRWDGFCGSSQLETSAISPLLKSQELRYGHIRCWEQNASRPIWVTLRVLFWAAWWVQAERLRWMSLKKLVQNFWSFKIRKNSCWCQIDHQVSRFPNVLKNGPGAFEANESGADASAMERLERSHVKCCFGYGTQCNL